MKHNCESRPQGNSNAPKHSADNTAMQRSDRWNARDATTKACATPQAALQWLRSPQSLLCQQQRPPGLHGFKRGLLLQWPDC
eukprot:9824161-Lingulodinium_polyedra.AAC.1